MVKRKRAYIDDSAKLNFTPEKYRKLNNQKSKLETDFQDEKKKLDIVDAIADNRLLMYFLTQNLKRSSLNITASELNNLQIPGNATAIL